MDQKEDSKSKPFKTFEEQIELLKKRKLKITDEQELLKYLKNANYQRIINGYNDPFFVDFNRKTNEYRSEVDSSMIISLYEFDRKIATLVNIYLHKIEVKLSTALCYEMLNKISRSKCPPLQNTASNLWRELFPHFFEKQKLRNKEEYETDEEYKKRTEAFQNLVLNPMHSIEPWFKGEMTVDRLILSYDEEENDDDLGTDNSQLFKRSLWWTFGMDLQIFRNITYEIKKQIVGKNHFNISQCSIKTFSHLLRFFKKLRDVCSHNVVIYKCWMEWEPKTKEDNSVLEIKSLLNREKKLDDDPKKVKVTLNDLVKLISLIIHDDEIKRKFNALVKEFQTSDCVDETSEKYILKKMGFVKQ